MLVHTRSTVIIAMSVALIAIVAVLPGGRRVHATPEPAVLAAVAHPDAAAYAADYHVSLAEAERRLSLQGSAGLVIEAIEGTNNGRFVGAWIEHEPDFRIVVRLTSGAGSIRDIDAIAAKSPVPVEIRTDAPRTLSELNDARKAIEATVKASFDVAGSYLDVKTDAVVVEIQPTSANRDKIPAAEAGAASRYGIPVWNSATGLRATTTCTAASTSAAAPRRSQSRITGVRRAC